MEIFKKLISAKLAFLLIISLFITSCDVLEIEDVIVVPGTIAGAASATEINYGETITYNDTSDKVASRVWTFQGGTPATSTDAEVTVLYEDGGNYTATLTIVHNDGLTRTLDFDVVVIGPPPPVVDEGGSKDIIFDWEDVSPGVITWDWQPSIIANPAQDAVNGSDNVLGAAVSGGEWDGFVIELDAPINFTNSYDFTMLVYAQAAGTVMLQLENGDDKINVTSDYTTPNAWQEVTFSFPEGSNVGVYAKIAIFVNHAGGGGGNIWALDDLNGPDAIIEVPKDIVFDWEEISPGVITWDWQPSIIANPAQDAVNGSDNVLGAAVSGGEWDGFVIELDAPINFTNSYDFTMLVYAQAAGTVMLQLENGDDKINVTSDYTTPNAWQEVTFSFPEGSNVGVYAKIAIFVNHAGGGGGNIWALDDLISPDDPM